MIPLLYTNKHQQHAPKVEYYHGNLLPYAEKPDRIEIMRDHLLKAALVDVIDVLDPMPESGLSAVLDPEMIAFMKHIPQAIEDRGSFSIGSMYKLEEGEVYLYPGFAPIRPFMMRLKDSQVGGMGYYFTDKEAPLGKGTWEAALFSATLAYNGAGLLLEDQSRLVYALCRPPGHHAGRDFMGGYCYFNNAAIAAERLKARGKVAILDIDYHHGNGTQAIFWDDPQVLFASIHADARFEYPYYAGYADETGGHQAPNLTLNYPLPAGTSSETFLLSFQDMLEKTKAFEPASIILSMGYDTYIHDPLSSFKLTEESYQEIGQRLRALGLPVLVVQEGGYQVEALGRLAEYLLKGLSS